MGGTIRRGTVALCAALAVGFAPGCGSAGYETLPDSAPSGDPLVATIAVETGDGAVVLTLHVTNPTSAPVELEFTSGQRFDFAVSRANGEAMWRWSADRSFMQALGTETLPAGGSLRYSATWPAAGAQGEFVARGEVTSSNRPVNQAVRFELAGDE